MNDTCRERPRRFPFLRLLCAAAALAAASAQAAPLECSVSVLQNHAAPQGVTIVSAEPVAAAGNVPAYCSIDAYLMSDGLRGEPDNRVGFQLGLPLADWNGKLLFGGGGGFFGSRVPMTVGVSRGYVSVQTDGGHTASSVSDASWAEGSYTRVVDFGHRAVHLTTVAAKAMVQAYYGEDLQRSYFFGCSTGGRQGLVAAERYPDDFDGVIAAAPALDYDSLMVAFNWNQQALLRSPEHYLPASKLQLIHDAVQADCDAKDGLADGLIEDPRACTFDPASLQCPSGDGPGCLTAGQVDTLRRFYQGPISSNGKLIHPGMPVGGEVTGWEAWVVGTVPPSMPADGRLDYQPGTAPLQAQFTDNYMRYLFFPVQDKDYDWRSFNFDTDPQKGTPMARTQNATGDLKAFRKRGGKLIIPHGWGDPVVFPERTVTYVKEVWKHSGGRAQAGDFMRLFMVPGMGHCAGGAAPTEVGIPLQADPPVIDADHDMLSALDRWVEEGVAPARVIASQVSSGAVIRTRPLCPYPQVARWTGVGSADDASNFVCVDGNYDTGAKPWKQ